MKHSGRIEIVAEALAPIHHGGGTDGNRQILRKQTIILPDGRRARVPFLSGNSFKHLLRDAAVRFAVEVMGVEDGALTKGQIHLLFSGGALSGGGSTVKLAQVREMEQLFPLLALAGYSAGNHMAGSKLQVSHWHLVCAENAWRLPESLKDHPHAKLRAGELIADEFGTRHEPTRANPTARALLCSGDAGATDLALEGALETRKSGGVPDRPSDSAQMIYDFETVVSGSVWFASVVYEDLKPLELAALKSALSYASKGVVDGSRLLISRGAKSAVGFGQMALSLAGSVREIEGARYQPGDEALPATTRDNASAELSTYSAHLVEHREAILAALKGAAR